MKLFFRGVLGLSLLLSPVLGEKRTFRILSINDVYRIAGLPLRDAGGPARVRALRAELERDGRPLLLLHAGDLLSPSFLSRSYQGRQMIDVLNLLDGDPTAFDARFFVTFGNHEFDAGGPEGAQQLQANVQNSQFQWLGSNVVFATDGSGQPVIRGDNVRPTALVEIGGIRVGLFGITIPLEKPSYVERFVDPLEAAAEASRELRAQGAEVVIGLTHQLVETDLEILEKLGNHGPDLIIGGHEHVAMDHESGGRWVYKADEDAVTANLVEVTLDGSTVSVSRRLVPLQGEKPAPDPIVWERVQYWLDRQDKEFCGRLGDAPGCLAEQIGRTQTDFNGAEIEIRDEETSAGNWVADVLREIYPGQAQVAFINSGALRLNQDIPGGSPITRREIEELLGFPITPQLIEVSGAALKRVLQEAVKGWPGGGDWLQVSGLAFVHDRQAGTVGQITLLTESGPRLLQDSDIVKAATIEYLVKESHEFSPILSSQRVLETSSDDLKVYVTAAVKKAGEAGIHPVVEGRICQDLQKPCLAIR